ncbi:linear gramicidin synthetase subunit C domain protein [Mycobacterium xenopi 3993]|nr:linear gramicidin synthetase subunit C domain protein [Mycobacterium xenopi 3993]
MADRPARHRLRHDGLGPTGRDGRADAMVGLFINTVPVRARLTPATTTAELLAQLQTTHNHTVEHQHLALNDIHRLTATSDCSTRCSCTRTTRSTPRRRWATTSWPLPNSPFANPPITR